MATKSELVEAVKRFNVLEEYDVTINNPNRFALDEHEKFEYLSKEELVDEISIAYEQYEMVKAAGGKIGTDEVDFSRYTGEEDEE